MNIMTGNKPVSVPSKIPETFASCKHQDQQSAGRQPPAAQNPQTGQVELWERSVQRILTVFFLAAILAWALTGGYSISSEGTAQKLALDSTCTAALTVACQLYLSNVLTAILDAC